MKKLIKLFTLFLLNVTTCLSGANQTPDTTPILTNQHLPFQIKIEQAFEMPNGLHSYAFGTYKGLYVLIAGRTNGMHSFDPGNNNFPPSSQNQSVFVINPATGMTFIKSLADPTSGLSQHQIDLLSVTSPQSYQKGNILYITGGYGVDTATGLFSTKDALSAIDLPGIIQWVVSPSVGETAKQYIRQIFNPVFQVTGGYMNQIDGYPTLLVFGQNFTGYYHDESNGIYTRQVRRFKIRDNGKDLSVDVYAAKPFVPDLNYRRRDLNVVPAIIYRDGRFKKEYVALSGVFTLTEGVWTVPVEITADGKTSMADPILPSTFKQGMNNYAAATIGLFTTRTSEMFTLLLGGISYGYFGADGSFKVDPEIPFINQLTAIKIDKKNRYTQYLLDGGYPVIYSTQSNPGNQLLFGAGADFFYADLPMYADGVLNLDAIKEPTVIGYIVGGIQSTVPNTEVASDSAASPYVFRVVLYPTPI